MLEALLLDVGYVIIGVTPAAVVAFADATGTDLMVDRLPPPGDERWGPRLGGSSTRDAYWDAVAKAAGVDGFGALFRTMAQTVPDPMIDADAVALMDDALEAGLRVGALSNDAYTYLGREFFAERPEFRRLHAFLDAAETGLRKPAPQAYLHAAAALGVDAPEVVFLDDTLECVDGAAAVGMEAVLVDPTDRRPAFRRARELLGLGPA